MGVSFPPPQSPLRDARGGKSLRIDCHLHTMWSGDATTTPDELAAAVATSGIDVVCVTDHSTIDGALSLAESGLLGVPVIVGEEMRTTEGELMGLFLTERVPFGLKPADAVARIRDQGGLVYVPHPFDPMRHCLSRRALEALVADGGVDVIETLNGKTSLASLNEEAAAFAREAGLPGGGGSDAHVPAAVGAAWVEVDDAADVTTPAGFLAAVRAPGASVGGGFSDPHRPWTARIVPSTKRA